GAVVRARLGRPAVAPQEHLQRRRLVGIRYPEEGQEDGREGRSGPGRNDRLSQIRSSGAYSSIRRRSTPSSKRTVTTPPASISVTTPSPSVPCLTESPVERSGTSLRGAIVGAP